MVFLLFPLGSMKGGTPVISSYRRHPKAHRSDCPLYFCLLKNSGAMYSSVPKKVVVETWLPSFFVVMLELETDEEEDASSAIDPSVPGKVGTSERPKSTNFV